MFTRDPEGGGRAFTTTDALNTARRPIVISLAAGRSNMLTVTISAHNETDTLSCGGSATVRVTRYGSAQVQVDDGLLAVPIVMTGGLAALVTAEIVPGVEDVSVRVLQLGANEIEWRVAANLPTVVGTPSFPDLRSVA